MKHSYLIHKTEGATLIELVISMVIISIALVGILSVINLTVSHSADPMLRHQAIAIAQSYMEEIQLRSYCDPDGGCGCTGTTTEASRSLYDNICDYHNLSDSGARDQDNNPFAELASYNVSVNVAETAFSTITASDAVKIEVRVTHNSGLIDYKLAGYRTNY